MSLEKKKIYSYLEENLLEVEPPQSKLQIIIFFRYIWPNIRPNMYESAYHLISNEKIEKPEIEIPDDLVFDEFGNKNV